MKRYFRYATLLALALALTPVALLSCSDDDDSPSAPATGMLRVELTDAPTDELAAVNVYISVLAVKPSSGEAVHVLKDFGVVDLLTLQGTTELLVTAETDPGDYEFVRMELDEAASSVVDATTGEELPLQISNEAVRVEGGGFTIENGSTTTLLLDFDADASLSRRANGDWLLTPVIVLADSSKS